MKYIIYILKTLCDILKNYESLYTHENYMCIHKKNNIFR